MLLVLREGASPSSVLAFYVGREGARHRGVGMGRLNGGFLKSSLGRPMREQCVHRASALSMARLTSAGDSAGRAVAAFIVWIAGSQTTDPAGRLFTDDFHAQRLIRGVVHVHARWGDSVPACLFIAQITYKGSARGTQLRSKSSAHADASLLWG